MKLSVVIFCDPVHDNSGAELLSAYVAQTLDHAKFQVLIVDNCDRTQIADEVTLLNARLPNFNLKYIQSTKLGRAAVVNEGIRLADSRLIAIMADDAVPSPSALSAFVEFHETNPHPLAVAIGPTLFREPLRRDPLRRWLEDSGTQFGVPMRTTFSAWPQHFFFTGNCAMKRTVFEEVGVFDERFPWITWDDFEFGTRLVAAGGYTQLVIGALAWHEHYVTLAERSGAMRKGGHAAAIHELIGPLSRAWEPMLERAHRMRHQSLLADDPALPLWQRIPRFERIFDREFLLGYESEVRGDRSDLVGLIASS